MLSQRTYNVYGEALGSGNKTLPLQPPGYGMEQRQDCAQRERGWVISWQASKGVVLPPVADWCYAIGTALPRGIRAQKSEDGT